MVELCKLTFKRILVAALDAPINVFRVRLWFISIRYFRTSTWSANSILFRSIHVAPRILFTSSRIFVPLISLMVERKTLSGKNLHACGCFRSRLFKQMLVKRKVVENVAFERIWIKYTDYTRFTRLYLHINFSYIQNGMSVLLLISDKSKISHSQIVKILLFIFSTLYRENICSIFIRMTHCFDIVQVDT